MEGIEPYPFKPVRQDIAEEEPDDASSESDEIENAGDTEKVGNLSWCTCDSSRPMETKKESICCQKVAELDQKLDGKELF